ncbi:hypothetical protein EWM57_07570 [Hymenobacter persicinus]|uniref:Uncharacterized protein n=1 Tax=Hymenobacter persicinus TaxID=2025506 RepID=A0A4Q5LEZ5_9BACT|nr:hypothetical protein EWM57_07570 [Hymenobacter persicinus]
MSAITRRGLTRRATILGAGGLLLSTLAHAQTPAPVATRVDSLRAARRGTPEFYPAQLTFTNGRQVQAFLPGYATCFLDRVECYETSPDRIPPPPLKAVAVERLRALSVDGHHYESLVLKGKPLGLLAENLGTPGPVELFGYAKTKNDMLIPVPLAMPLLISTGTHEKYYWYVRTRGGELREVPRGDGEFAKEMSTFFAANPNLAARIREKEKGARVEDMRQLVQTYNDQQRGK